jgi:hypothetical protein
MADNSIDPTNTFEVVKDNSGTTYRRTVAHLPGYYRTDSNQRFLGSTLDPIIQKGDLKRLDGYIGRLDAYTRSASDRYLEATTPDRTAYQFEPAVTYVDQDTSSINPEDQVKFTATYDDLLNQLKYFNAPVDNQDRLTKEKVYSWNPSVDLDKIINYREYYWVPNGLTSIPISEIAQNTTTEIVVSNTSQDGSTLTGYVFSNKPSETNPIITLYRGNTYKFNIKASGHPFYIMTEPFPSGVAADGSTSVIYSDGVSGDGTDEGTVTFTVPTSAPNTLYYQCGIHTAMYGVLQIKTATATTKIDVASDIIGTKNYTTNKGVALSNGMKVNFKSNVVDTATYKDKDFYVEGVGDSITLTPLEDLITPESYATETTILYDSVGYDTRPYAKAFYRPETHDYITIKRDSLDRNAWSRYNRWFHKSAIEATGTAMGFTPVLNESDRAKRPIIEFDSNLSLYNHGTVSKKSVTLVDAVTTDVFTDMVNQTGYYVDGIQVTNGMRILFTADTDILVRNKVYKVNFVTISGTQKIALQLDEESDTNPIEGESVYVEFGKNFQGKTLYYTEKAGPNKDEKTWITGQNKTKVNQQPLFDIYDSEGNSFSNDTAYPSTNFAGSEIFSFKISNSATTDTVLGLKIKYNTINNVGDIVFESDLNSGSFQYKSGNDYLKKFYSTGFMHKTLSLLKYEVRSNWIERESESKQRVKRTHFATDTEKKLFPIDVYKNSASLTDLEVEVIVNGIHKQLTKDYTLVNGTTNKFVKFVKDLSVNDVITIYTYSSKPKVDAKGVYDIPEALGSNPLNEYLTEFTYGQIATHLVDVVKKNSEITGVIPGPTNLRDNPEVYLKGGSVQQHGGSLTSAMFNLIDKDANLPVALDFCELEYQRFKENFLTHATGTTYEGDVAGRVDEILSTLAKDKNNTFPFYYDDMVGFGEQRTLRTITVQDSSQTEYAIDSQFSTTTLSNRAVYVYKNDVQLLLGSEYTFSTTDDTINITATITAGDVIKIKDYNDTTGSFIPPTPTKMGITPKYTPEKITDNTYRTSQTVIVGHDGSRTIAYDDYRDDILLELEKRIYNNIKISQSELLHYNDIIPSAFSTKEYTLQETNDVLSTSFYKWAGANNVDYRTNSTYSPTDNFTFNWSSSVDMNSEGSLGYWRAIFHYYYDTDRPHTHPWEMIGYSEKPTGWEDRYGSAPYTEGNEILWEDMERGYDFVSGKIKKRYVRKGLSFRIPVDNTGELRDPATAGLFSSFNRQLLTKQWQFGDRGPAETSWRRSSNYPFALAKMMALLKPAKFFGVFLDNSRLVKNSAGNYVESVTARRQTLKGATYHLETVTDSATGIVTRYQTSGYQPFVVNYLISLNLDPARFYYDKMKNLKVQLAYKLGGFTDKGNIKVLTDSISPGSTSGSQFIPDENYKVVFRTSNPIKRYSYSGVLIEKNSTLSIDGSSILPGYRIVGYDLTNPVFKMYQPIQNSNFVDIKVGTAGARLYKNFSDQVETVVYGTVFETIDDVCNFLQGYGKYLEAEGFNFEKYSKELERTLNWETAVREFLYWVTQGWASGSAITVSPGADGFTLKTDKTVIGKLQDSHSKYTILDAGGRSISRRELSIKKIGSTFDLTSLNPEVGIYGIKLHSVEKEHILLFDNKTVFNDIIFDGITGFRQQRLKIVGWKTAGWNGDLHAPGFIFDQAKVSLWIANNDYKIGDTVEYNAKFYVAKINHNSGAKFVASSWMKKDAKPSAQLLPNFDYKIAQFNDFYNLETNNFDEGQQFLAQHLTGYQSRTYLENLFVNDISQYKFYQGFIKEKGSLNAITKLARAKFLDEDIDLSIYPEWMIRTGMFGNVDGTKSIQIKLSDTEILMDPQSIELVDTTNDSIEYSRSAKIPSSDFYDKPLEYTPSTTFSLHDYTKQGTDRETVQFLKTAGYPRLDDINHTAFNINDLLNLDPTAVKSKQLIWIANNKKSDWDVLRLTPMNLRLVGLQSINNNTQLTVDFDTSHSLSVEDYVMISNSQYEDLNGVYIVQSIPSPNSIIINYTKNISTLVGVSDKSTANTYGNISQFVSVRMSSIDDVYNNLLFEEFQEEDTVNDYKGDRLFVDNTDSTWKVYERTNPNLYNQIISSDTTAEQEFGYQVVARNDGRLIAITAPGKLQGELHFYFRRSPEAGTAFKIQSTNILNSNNDNTSKFGYSLSMSTDENFIVSGAPFNNTSIDNSTEQSDQGLVRWYQWDSTNLKYDVGGTIYPPYDVSSSRIGLNFGWAHKISEPTDNSLVTTKTKYMFVSAPGYDNDTGIVHMYVWGVGADGSTYSTWVQTTSIQPAEVNGGWRFGHRLAANDNGDILAISSQAPGHAGVVHIFKRTSQTNDSSSQHTWSEVQTLKGHSDLDGSTLDLAFGDSISMSKDGTTLVIGAPGYEQQDGSTQTYRDNAGVVYYYKWNADGSTNTYSLQQRIDAPSTASNTQFGSTLDLNDNGNRLVIGAKGSSSPRIMKIDTGSTTFDLQDTNIIDFNTEAGAVYTATKYDNHFIVDQRLTNDDITSNDKFGSSVCMVDQSIFVGSPNDDAGIAADGSSIVTNDGSVAHYDLKTNDSYAWKVLRQETNLVNDKRVQSSFIFNRSTSKIIDYLNYYDPVKGRIFGIADREIKYKTTWDPADYNYNVNGEVRAETCWGDEHVGETWWDLSQAKWIWYEQGDQEYKTKNWGKLFPGARIDVYEWVESTLLPSEWNATSGTTEAQGTQISGTPYAPEDDKFTLKEKYDSIKDEFVNYYYYWVRDSVIVPNAGKSAMVRQNSTAFISNILTNPKASGLRYFSITDKNKILIYNVKNDLQDSNIVLNIDYKENDNETDAHKVWKILAEGDPNIRPDSTIESKWWDSLCGSDSAGSIVPDPELPVNRRYGNAIRPRQSWYIDRFEALKEVIDYSNLVLKENQLVGSISFDNLDSFEPEPTTDSLEYDGTVDTYADLTYLHTPDFSGTVNYLVKADETANNLWSIYEWNGTSWNRTKIQTYKTNNYWSYTDWYATGTAEDVRIDKQVTYQYQLDSVSVNVGDHVKVTQADSGGWKIYKYTAKGFENVGTENGTIKLSTKLYDYSQDNTGYAGEDTYDENFFDQEPILETRKVLTALRDDIFTGALTKEYNTIFFIGLRYVLSEQLYVDWLFKSSFLNITNSLRPLNQRKTYTTGKDDYVESYINEVKPFHTKIREYKLKYTNTETQDGLNTDFDLPPFYDVSNSKTRPPLPEAETDTELLETFPYKMWKDYHTKYVQSIKIINGGTGYTKAPTVTFVGGVKEEVGPYSLLGRSNAGSTSGNYGYYYPLYTIQSNANVADKQNGGSGTSHGHTFDEYPGRTFYMPNSMMNHGESTNPGTYKIFAVGSQTQATGQAVISQGKVAKINILTKGSGYTTTPEIILSGGKDDGTTPSDSARAYAVLNNDLVRDFDTTIKFDRIKSSASVSTWTASTTYEYGTLIRHNNELYRASQRITTGAKFTLTGLQKLRGDEEFITAAERTQGLYAPTSGMPGNELSQVMTGVDYGGVMVTGLTFGSEVGWDKSDWYEQPWDSAGGTRIKTFYGDGSTVSFAFDRPPAQTDVYTVYFDGVRQTNEVHRGDSSTATFTLSSVPGNNVKIEFIPFDEDRSFTPTDDKTLDSQISGGLFGSALGIDPNHVITDGDDFVSPETSYAPEEAVPGQLFDTLDIQVYTAPESGVPFIVEKNYFGDGTTTTFGIGQKPGTQASVSVIVDNVRQTLGTEFTVDVANETITFSSAPANNKKITIKSFAVSGQNYMVLDNFKGDGSTRAFTTGTRESFALDSTSSQLYVTVNGVPTTAYATSSTANTITVTFNSAPTSGHEIQIAGFNQASGRAFAEIQSNNITFDGSTTRYTLTYPVGTYGPYAGLSVIEHEGKVLRGPDNTYYVGDGSTYSYGVVSSLSDTSTVDPAKTITSASQVEVYLNGGRVFLNSDYTVDIGAQTVVFNTAPQASDVIAITTNVDNHYSYIGGDIVLETAQIATDGITLTAGDVLTVTTFNNALGMKARREVLEGRISGQHYLYHTPLNSNYVYVWFNSIPLQQGQDYTVAGNVVTIIGRTITASDRVDVMYFAVDTAVNSTGFRIFKDMLNRTFYKRIAKNTTTTLAQDLAVDDRTITVVDGSVLGEVDGTTKLPGVIFINKERIEYFVKSGNTLSQIRRGTLGTGIKAHVGGTSVVDASGKNTVPYSDTIYTDTHTGDGSTVSFATTIAPTSASQLDIFIGGQRLLLTSEDGSTVNYTVDGSTAVVTLTTAPSADVQVKILQKKGNVWYNQGTNSAADGKGLQKATSNAAKFIAEEPTNTPK